MGLLAFGTEDGRVGLYEVHSQRYTSLPSAHRNTIYELAWRRVCVHVRVVFICLYQDGEAVVLTRIKKHISMCIYFFHVCVFPLYTQHDYHIAVAY